MQAGGEEHEGHAGATLGHWEGSLCASRSCALCVIALAYIEALQAFFFHSTSFLPCRPLLVSIVPLHSFKGLHTHANKSVVKPMLRVPFTPARPSGAGQHVASWGLKLRQKARGLH
eukprot:1148461-Pelagomonas_calceolata.AAC.4